MLPLGYGVGYAVYWLVNKVAVGYCPYKYRCYDSHESAQWIYSVRVAGKNIR